MSAGFVAQLAREERAAQRERAKRLVAEHFPNTGGTTATGGVYLDGWAVMAVLNLWHQHGEGKGKVTLGQVRAERQRLLGRLNERNQGQAA